MKTQKELEKEKKDLQNQLKKYEKVPDFGDDTESDFEEEADEAEEYGKNLGVVKALKERLVEIETELQKVNRKKVKASK